MLAIPHRLRQRLIVFGVAALVLASAVAWLDVQRVVRPLQRLTDIADRFAAGQLDEPVRLDRRDEIGVLAQALETMRQRLRASLQEVACWNRELERRVEQRTQELQAVASENARLLAELQRKEAQWRQLLEKYLWAHEEERKRVARELHDEIGQGLTGLVMGLASIENMLPAGAARHRLADLRELTSSTLAEVRRIMLDLRPSLLDDLGLAAAIGWYLERHLGGTEIQHEVRLVGLGAQERLPPEVETTLFRVVQEAVTNVLKHARARTLQVELHRRAQDVLAYIRDDGCGFDPTRVAADRRTRKALAFWAWKSVSPL
jgi:signal transduction histidine kinase